jgi:hypothetical protein
MKNFIQDIRVLDDEQLKIINEYIDTLTFKVNTIFDADGNERQDTSVRSSTGSVMSDGDFATQILHEGMNTALLEYRDRLFKSDIALDGYPIPGARETSSHREGIQVLEYTKEQKYNYHFDACTDPKSDFYHRQVSVVLYLKDDFEGGATKFKMLPEHDFRPEAFCKLFTFMVLMGQSPKTAMWISC